MATIPKFFIPFSSPYSLDEDIDFRAFYQGEALDYVKNRVIGYNAQQLIVGVQSQGQKERKVTFNISPEALQVSCNCKSAEGTLCAHGYHVLHELCWNSKRFFTIFEPGSLVSIALENKNLFHINYSNPDKFIVPDKSLRHLYDFKKIESTEMEQLSALPLVALPVRETELVWLLIYSPYSGKDIFLYWFLLRVHWTRLETTSGILGKALQILMKNCSLPATGNSYIICQKLCIHLLLTGISLIGKICLLVKCISLRTSINGNRHCLCFPDSHLFINTIWHISGILSVILHAGNILNELPFQQTGRNCNLF